jgi:sorting nexin-8
MSIFDDTPSRPSRSSKPSSSLFDDDAAPARNSASLFADDGADAATAADSPWSFLTPKRAARSALIKTLLPPGAVSEWYVDVYDKLLVWDADNGPGGGPTSGIDYAAARKMLEESGLDEESRQRVSRVLGVEKGKSLGQGEVNVLIALVGLAQEGEEVTLDGVDERRKSMCFCHGWLGRRALTRDVRSAYSLLGDFQRARGFWRGSVGSWG